MDLINVIFWIAGVWFVFCLGCMTSEERVKRLLTATDLGSSHFFLSFGIFGFKEHTFFNRMTHFCLTVPGLQVVEHWDRMIGPFWVRVGLTEMSRDDLEYYYEQIWAMMEAKHAAMGFSAGQDAPSGVFSQDPPDAFKPTPKD